VFPVYRPRTVSAGYPSFCAESIQPAAVMSTRLRTY